MNKLSLVCVERLPPGKDVQKLNGGLHTFLQRGFNDFFGILYNRMRIVQNTSVFR